MLFICCLSHDDVQITSFFIMCSIAPPIPIHRFASISRTKSVFQYMLFSILAERERILTFHALYKPNRFTNPKRNSVHSDSWSFIEIFSWYKFFIVLAALFDFLFRCWYSPKWPWCWTSLGITVHCATTNIHALTVPWMLKPDRTVYVFSSCANIDISYVSI